VEITMNFMDLVKPYLTQSLMQKAASWLGESESGVAKALAAILPTLMGTVLSKSDNRGFMDGLGSMLNNPAMDHGAVLGDVGALFGAGAANSPLSQLGGNFLGSLFGDKQQAVSQAISQHAGVGVGSVAKLLGAAAPMLLALLGKQSSLAGGLGALMGLLGGQKAALLSAIPGSIGGLLGLGSGASSAASSFSANAASARQETKSGGFPLWLIPLLALGGLGAWWLTKGKPEETVVVSAPVVATPVAPIPAPVEPTPMPTPDVAPLSIFPDLGTFGERVLPGDIKLNIPAMGIESKIVTFIEDAALPVDKETWFDFDRILFDTGAATLRTESNEQISNIASILKAFPNVQLKVGGYTDNTGNADANLKLSADRAAAVTSAIVALGVDAARLKSEGYGQEHAVADNATEEGRQKNRRVSARVTAK
jgi:OmpA-OmpF porin, OOP family